MVMLCLDFQPTEQREYVGAVSSHYALGNFLRSNRQLMQSQIFTAYSGIGLELGTE